jgi:glucosyl-dolichyl phosphate glucuronosyltransferase
MSGKTCDVSVIICAYTEQRWEDLLAAVDSVCKQTLPANEIIVVIDHNPQLLRRVQEHLPDVIAIENKEQRGLSGARNSGIARAQSSLMAFLDDDAIATPDWLHLLQADLEDPQVLGIGGAVIPRWLQPRTSWFPDEFLWVIGCTYLGMPQTGSSIRNPIGANMAIRREVFYSVGGFRNAIGRVGTRPVGCEETELCIRAHQHWPQRRFIYKPEASVSHRIPGNRMTWRYFCARCYSEGISKATISRLVGAQDSLASERTYTLVTLPKGVARGLRDGFCKLDLTGFLRASAIVTGLVTTATGYLVGKISRSYLTHED